MLLSQLIKHARSKHEFWQNPDNSRSTEKAQRLFFCMKAFREPDPSWRPQPDGQKYKCPQRRRDMDMGECMIAGCCFPEWSCGVLPGWAQYLRLLYERYDCRQNFVLNHARSQLQNLSISSSALYAIIQHMWICHKMFPRYLDGGERSRTRLPTRDSHRPLASSIQSIPAFRWIKLDEKISPYITAPAFW